MANLNDDIKYADDVLNGKNEDLFSFIYSRTNENLIELFNRIHFTNKDIYTVLSSSDFLFETIWNGANKVDCFDINPITYRYFYLRKWLLEYGLMDADGESLETLKWIAKKHMTSLDIDEQESSKFWFNYLSKIDNIHFYSNVLFEYIESPEVPHKTKEERKLLSEKLKRLKLEFSKIDICKETIVPPTRKYDGVYLSNILDYNRDMLRLQTTCKNMLNILKANGFVACSHMSQYPLMEMEKDVFLEYFNYDELFVDKVDSQEILYYRYTRKK